MDITKEASVKIETCEVKIDDSEESICIDTYDLPVKIKSEEYNEEYKPFEAVCQKVANDGDEKVQNSQSPENQFVIAKIEENIAVVVMDIIKEPSVKIETCELKTEDSEESICIDTYNLPVKIEEYNEEYKPFEAVSQKVANDGDEKVQNSQSPENQPKRKTAKVQAQKRVRKQTKLEEPLKCTSCDYQTKVKRYFQRHLLCHRDPSTLKLYSCEHCDYRTRDKPSLVCHRLLHLPDSEVEMFSCPDCEFKTKRKRTLRRHKLMHKDESEIRMFECDRCPFRSKFKANLAQHQLKHKDAAEVTMYKCEECDYESRFKSNVRTHALTHRDNLEVPVYRCELCSYESKFPLNLRRHMQRHEEVKEEDMLLCGECNYRAKHKRNLAKHLTMHNGTLFSCQHCNYQTKWKSMYNRHQLQHRPPDEVLIHGDTDYIYC